MSKTFQFFKILSSVIKILWLTWGHSFHFQGYITDVSTQTCALHGDFEYHLSLFKWQRWHIQASEDNFLKGEPSLVAHRALKWICVRLDCNLRFRRFIDSVSGRKSWCDLPKLPWRIWLGTTIFLLRKYVIQDTLGMINSQLIGRVLSVILNGELFLTYFLQISPRHQL